MAEEINKKDIEELRRLIKLLNKDISEADFESLVKSGNAAKTLLSSLRKEAEEFTSDISDINNGFKNIVNEIRRTHSTTNDVAKSFDKLSNVAEQIKFHQRGISQLSLKEIQSSQTKVAIERERLRDSISSLTQRKSELQTQLNELNIKKATIGLTDAELKERRKLGQEYEKTKVSLNNINSIISGQDELYNGLVTTIDKVKNQIEDSNKLLGLGGTIITGLSETLKKIGFDKLSNQLGIDEAKDKMRSLSQQIIADREREINLQNNIKNLSEEAIKVSDQLVNREKELLDVKEKINLIDSLTQRKDELRFQLEELNAKKLSIGLTQNEIKERRKLGREYNNLKVSLKDLGPVKTAKELEDSLERQVEIIKQKKEEINNVIKAEKEELNTVTAINTQYRGIGGKMAVLKTGLTSMGKSLASNLTDVTSITGFVIAAFKKFVELGFKANKETTSLSKTLASSMEEARGLRNTFVDIENGSIKINSSIDKLFLTTENLTKAYGELASIFGTSLGFTNQQVADQVLLTEQIGLSGEEASGLQQLMLASGMTADQIVDSTIKQTSALARQKGIQLDNKKILGEVAKVSGQLRAQYQNNPDLIAKAVIQTQKLGMSLQQASDASKGLLDFESSINAELEAELLTGRDINLDRARFLRLNGKVAESMQEIFNEVGDINDFMNMNTIQQEALANLAGMTTDELANTLLYQSNLNKLGNTTKKQISDRVEQLKKEGQIEKANQLMRSIGNEEEAKAALGRIDAQQRINKLLVKLESMFGNIIAPIAEELLGKLEEYIKQIDFEKLARDTKEFVTELVEAVRNINDIAKKLSGIFPEGTGKVLAGLAGAATIGLLISTIGNLLVSSSNPAIAPWVRISPFSAPSMGGPTTGLPPSTTSPSGKPSPPTGKGVSGVLKTAGRIGGYFAVASALMDLYTNLTEKNEETGEKSRSTANALLKTADQNKFTLLGAGIGAAFGGIGAIPGAAIGGALDYFLSDTTQLVEDAVISKTGLVAAKYSKGKLKPIAQGSPDDNIFFTPNKVESSPLAKNITQPLGDKTPNIVVELKENKIDQTPNIVVELKENKIDQTQTVKISMIEVLMSKIDSLITTIDTQISNLTPKFNLDDLTTVVNVDLPKFDDVASKLDLLIESINNLVSKFNLDKLTTVVNIDLPKFDNVGSKLDALIESINNLMSKFNLDKLTTVVNIDLPRFDTLASKLDLFIDQINNLISKLNLDNLTTVVNIDLPKFDNVASKLDSLINQNDNVVSKVNNNVSISRIEVPLLEVINSSINRIESHLSKIVNKTTPDKENIISIDKIETPSPLIDTNTTISETNINKPIRESDNVEKAIKRLEESFVKAIGAIKDRPIEIHTIAEIDGEKAGRTLSRYATSNGTTIDVFSVKTQ